VALAVVHDLGATASVWLEALLEERLERATLLDLEPRPSGNGFVLRARVATPEAAERLMRASHDALAAKVAPGELARIAERASRGPLVRSWTGDADRAVGDCVGELSSRAPATAPTLVDLERYRQAIFSTKAVALAAVGPRPVLDAVARALRDGEDWPTESVLSDPWPAGDVAGAAPGDPGSAAVSVALRLGDPARALDAAKELGARGSLLVAHVEALEPAWSVVRVVGTTRARGACLRVDLDAAPGNPVTPSDAAGVAALALDEASRAVAGATANPWSLDRGVLESTDPRDAATIAAWRALAMQLEPGPTRVFASYLGSITPDGGGAFARALDEARAERQKPSIELRRAAEVGQGETWMLLASPCATLSESSQTAGLAALTVRALAHDTPELDGVHIEPWVSGTGVGLLAHGTRLGPAETSREHADRVASALGRVLAATRITDESAAAARLRLQADLGQETELLWPVAIEALAPRHPSLLDPRGTWQSVTELPTHAAEVERRALVRGPLRLAILSNSETAQIDGAELSLERWLRPERRRAVDCPSAPAVLPRAAEYEVDPPSGGAAGSRALVAVAVPPSPTGGLPLEAEWTAHLLNREHGWLDRSVRVPGLAIHAEATVLGGRDAAALAIEIVATGDRAREAASQARAVLARLAEGAATAEDLAAARLELEQASALAAVDPRQRVVQLWLGGMAPKPPPDLAALRRFHHDVLAPERHVVVLPRVHP